MVVKPTLGKNLLRPYLNEQVDHGGTRLQHYPSYVGGVGKRNRSEADHRAKT
jgi:hypothetical protein